MPRLVRPRLVERTLDDDLARWSEASRVRILLIGCGLLALGVVLLLVLVLVLHR